MRNISITLFLTFLLSSFIFGQNEHDTLKYKLSDVIVTSNRVGTHLMEIANSVTVISKEEIILSQKNTIYELLNSVPGLSVANQGGLGRLSSIFIRGASSNHTLVMIDGIKLNDPSSPNNGYDLSNIQVNGIERIEIVRGPQSVLYGSDAMAGIVNIITAKGQELNRLIFKSEIGSQNFLNGSGTLSGGLHNTHYSLSFSRLQTDGFSAIDETLGSTENDGHSNNSLSFAATHKFIDNFEISTIYRYNYVETDLDRSSPTGDDPNFTYDNEEQIIGMNLNLGIGENIWVNELNASLSKKISHSINYIDEYSGETSFSNSNSQRLKFGWQNNLNIFSNNKIILGVEHEIEQANNYNKSVSSFGPFESIFPKEKISTTGIFLHDQFHFSDYIFAGIGFRYDINQKYGNVITYRLTPAYYINSTNTRLKMSLGKGFKAPSIFNLFDPLYGNPDLNAEKSLGWDFGIEQYLQKQGIRIEINYFNNTYDDLIGFDSNFRTVNIEKAKTDGYEFIFSIRELYNFSIDMNYTYTRALDKSENSFYKDEQLIRRPKNRVNFTISYLLNNSLYIRTTFKYVGERFDNNYSVYPSERIKLDSYNVIDISASYQLFDSLKIYGRIENLFDEQYEEVLFYGTSDRTFYTGIEVNINNIF